MKRRLSFAVPFLLGASVVQGQRAPDAVAIDPTHHTVLFENNHVRVFRALVAPGARSPMHSHPRRVLVSLGNARLRFTLPDGTNPIFDLHPGQVLWMDSDEHAWEMVSGQAHVIGVEVKAAMRAAPPPFRLPANDPVTADPVGHQVALENEHVRVLTGLAGQGYRPGEGGGEDLEGRGQCLAFVVVRRGARMARLLPGGVTAELLQRAPVPIVVLPA
jgi:quercetin dioxygenase-like cupin family protein